MSDRPSALLLSGATWQCGAAPRRAYPLAPQALKRDGDAVSEWLPATVPGEPRLTLQALGRIPDPYVADQLAASRWVEACDWWYRRSLAADLPPGRRAFLVFAGLDYLNAVTFNGTLLGQQPGMHAPRRYEVTALWRAENVVAVRLWGGTARPRYRRCLTQRLARFAARHLLAMDLFPDRLATLACQMSYGWDFAPRLLTSGIWDDVWLETTGAAQIVGLRLVPQGHWGRARLVLHLRCETTQPGRYDLTVTTHGLVDDLPGPTHAVTLDLPTGESAHVVTLTWRDAVPWQPWEHGPPTRYVATVVLRQGATEHDRRTVTFGFRSIALDAVGRRGDALRLRINGRPLWMRGVNWVPADALFHRVTADDYAALLGRAKEANVNLLRVWGGGLREKRAFYERCDAEGLLVWQEFPLAVSFGDHYPRDVAFLALAAREAQGIVSYLQHHPSLVLWCGGNEFSPRQNRALVATLASTVARYDGTRPFLPASPWGSDHHNWWVWHAGAPVRDYMRERAVLLSEFGLQAVPSVASLRRFLPPDRLYPPNDLWRQHHAELDKLVRYAGRPDPDDVWHFVWASQRAQAYGLQAAIEHMRRRRARTAGTIVWQFNEPWPAICWSILDYYRQPKLAYYLLRRLYAPLLVSFAFPWRRYRAGDTLRGTLWLVNDSAAPVADATLTVLLGRAKLWQGPASVPADTARPLGDLAVHLPDTGILRLLLIKDDTVLAENAYDLTYEDRHRVGPAAALRHWLTWHLFLNVLR
jgi:beta-mannosidase